MSASTSPLPARARYVIRICANGQYVVVAADMEWCYLPCAQRRYTNTLKQAKALVALMVLAAVAS